jgi:hypothetical protein
VSGRKDDSSHQVFYTLGRREDAVRQVYSGDVEPGTGPAIRAESPETHGKLASVGAGETSRPLNRVVPSVLAWLLAMFFAVWAMRGATATDITLNDQARHALNGAALLDMVREGGLSRPTAWLRDYFAHYPALSMPYHPPLFPAVEALFYAAFGVSPVSARLAVAGFVAGAVLLFFHQVRSLQKNSYVAAACVLIFFSLPLTQMLSADVMLELPALFWVLASTVFIASARTEWRLRDAILAGSLAGAAVWTKQTIFVGLIPLLLLASRRFAGLRSRNLLIFFVIFGLFVAGFMMLGRAADFAGISKDWRPVSVPDRVIRGIHYYGLVVYRQFGPVAMGGIVAAAVLFRATLRNAVVRDTYIFYLSWLAASVGVLLAVPAYDKRYLWFAYPALVVVASTAVHSVLAKYSDLKANVAVLAIATVFCVWNLRTEPLRVTGPAAAAALTGTGGRVLYCGTSNGSFIFAMRMLDERRTTHVIRADKVITPMRDLGLAPFVQKFGINTIVAEANPSSSRCEDFRQHAGSLNAHRESVPIRSNLATMEGTLEIYRMPPAPHPAKGSIDLPIQSTGQAIRVEF